MGRRRRVVVASRRCRSRSSSRLSKCVPSRTAYSPSARHRWRCPWCGRRGSPCRARCRRRTPCGRRPWPARPPRSRGCPGRCCPAGGCVGEVVAVAGLVVDLGDRHSGVRAEGVLRRGVGDTAGAERADVRGGAVRGALDLVQRAAVGGVQRPRRAVRGHARGAGGGVDVAGPCVAARDGVPAPPASRPPTASVAAAATVSSAFLICRNRGLTVIVESAHPSENLLLPLGGCQPRPTGMTKSCERTRTAKTAGRVSDHILPFR